MPSKSKHYRSDDRASELYPSYNDEVDYGFDPNDPSHVASLGTSEYMDCPHCGSPNFWMGGEFCGNCGERGDAERCGPNCKIETHQQGRKFFVT